MTEKANRLLQILKRKAKDGFCVIGSHELADQLGISEKGVRIARAILYNNGKIDFGSQISQPGRGIKNWYKLLSSTQAGRATPQKVLEKKSLPVSSGKQTGKKVVARISENSKDPNVTIYTNTKGRKRKDSSDERALTLADELIILELAGRIIGRKIVVRSAFGRRARKYMRARVKEGFTRDELVQACRYAAKEWDNGNRWRGLKDISYIWGMGFQPILACKGEAGRYDKRQPEFAKGEDRERWLEQVRQRTEDA